MNKSFTVFILGLVSIVLNGCSGCVQSNYKQMISPDGQHALIEREIDCSALDPRGTLISIQSERPRLGIEWLGFAHKQVFAADVPLNRTQVKWLDNRNVEVTCTGCEKYGIATRVEVWKDIRVHLNAGNARNGVF